MFQTVGAGDSTRAQSSHASPDLEELAESAIAEYTRQSLKLNQEYLQFASGYYKKLMDGLHVRQEDIQEVKARLELCVKLDEEYYQVVQTCLSAMRESSKKPLQPKVVEIKEEGQETRLLKQACTLYYSAMMKAHQLSRTYILSQLTKIPTTTEETQARVNDCEFLNHLISKSDSQCSRIIHRIMHIYAKKHSQEAITGAQMQDVISFHIESSNEINTQLIQYIVSNLKKKKVSQEDFNATIYFNKLRTQFYDRTYHFLNTLIELRSSPINRIGALAEKIQLTQQRLLEATALYSQATRHTNRQATQHAVSQFRAATRGEDVQDLDASYKKYCETVQTIFSQITECCQQLNFLIL